MRLWFWQRWFTAVQSELTLPVLKWKGWWRCCEWVTCILVLLWACVIDMPIKNWCYMLTLGWLELVSLFQMDVVNCGKIGKLHKPGSQSAEAKVFDVLNFGSLSCTQGKALCYEVSDLFPSSTWMCQSLSCQCFHCQMCTKRNSVFLSMLLRICRSSIFSEGLYLQNRFGKLGSSGVSILGKKNQSWD